ncbi:MAG: recombinase family protein, partial [Alphaproteobacteria bacterium]|nr:recombinase family protein [Alphaproteobacteria bacterium]
MDAVILARVSSREQEQGMSIDAQLENMRNYCKRQKLNIIKEYVLTESSTRGDRKKFEEMLKFVKTCTQKIAIIADCIDRIQRSFKESVELDELRKNDKIEIHFIRENLILHKDSSSTDIARWDLGVFTAKTYVGNLRDNVKRSIDYNTLHGIWQSKAPIGYLNRRNELNRPIIIIDPARAPIIIKLFELYSTGRYSLSEIAKHSEKMGLISLQNKIKLSKTAIQNILKNPFYSGTMIVKGRQYTHIHPTLISPELFYKCQQVMQNKNNGRQKYAEKMFALRGIIRCATCGNTISCDEKTKTNGKTYVYLRCVHHKNGCNQPEVNEKAILDQVKREIFDKLVVPKNILTDIMQHLRTTVQAENAFYQSNIDQLNSQLENTHNKVNKLLDLLLDDRITQNDYDKKLDELRQQEFAIRQKIKSHT